MNWVDEMTDCGAVYKITMVPRIISKRIVFDPDKYGVIIIDGSRIDNVRINEHHRVCSLRQGKTECTCP